LDNNKFTKVFTNIEQFVNRMNTFSKVNDKLYEFYNNCIITKYYSNDDLLINLLRNKDLIELYLHNVSDKMYAKNTIFYDSLRTYCVYKLRELYESGNLEIIEKINNLNVVLYTNPEDVIVNDNFVENVVENIDINQENNLNNFIDYLSNEMDIYFKNICENANIFDTNHYKQVNASIIYVLIYKFNYNL